MRRAVLALSSAAAAGVLVLSGCTSGPAEKPNYRPSPTGAGVEGPGVRVSPILPEPSLAGGGDPGGGSSSGAPSSSAGTQQDPQVVATKLTTPVGLTMLPDNTALVGERTTGRIVRVQPEAGKPVPTVRTLPGVDGAGDGGLLDLALSPTYAEDSLIYAYLTTRTDNRVVAFTLDGPVTPVLTGIPRGRTGNAGRLLFAGSGTLFVGTGDTGRPALATNARSLAGKVLRINDIGAPATGNPTPSSPVYSSGLRTLGLCPIPKTTTLLQVEANAARRGEINSLAAGGDYTRLPALGATPAASGAPGDCAVLNSRLYVASLDGRALLSAPLSGAGAKLKVGPFVELLKNTYGRLRTVVAAADGALWLTTSNRDGRGKPVAADERVIRYQPDPTGGGTNPA